MPQFDPTQWDKQIFTTKDILSELPVTRYLVSPVMVIPSFNLFYGIPGSLKTNILIDLAICVSLGCNWLTSEDFCGFKTDQANILWVDCDSGKNILHERLSAFLREHAKNETQAHQAKIYFMSFPHPQFSAMNDAMVLAIIEIIKRLECRLVVFDNLGTVSGGADENSFEMVKVMNNLRYISEKSESAVNAIHHISKNSDNGNGRKTPRGHSSIEAALDTAFYIERSGDSISVIPTKQRRSPVEPFSALFEYEHFPKTKTLCRASFIGSESEPDPISLKAKNAIIKFINHPGKLANQKELIAVCKEFKIGRPRAISEIHRLSLDNILIKKPNQDHNQIIYSLNPKWDKKG